MDHAAASAWPVIEEVPLKSNYFLYLYSVLCAFGYVETKGGYKDCKSIVSEHVPLSKQHLTTKEVQINKNEQEQERIKIEVIKRCRLTRTNQNRGYKEVQINKDESKWRL